MLWQIPGLTCAARFSDTGMNARGLSENLTRIVSPAAGSQCPPPRQAILADLSTEHSVAD